MASKHIWNTSDVIAEIKPISSICQYKELL